MYHNHCQLCQMLLCSIICCKVVQYHPMTSRTFGLVVRMTTRTILGIIHSAAIFNRTFNVFVLIYAESIGRDQILYQILLELEYFTCEPCVPFPICFHYGGYFLLLLLAQHTRWQIKKHHKPIGHFFLDISYIDSCLLIGLFEHWHTILLLCWKHDQMLIH